MMLPKMMLSKLLQHKKWLMLAVAALSAAVAGYYLYAGKTTQNITPKVTSVERGDMMSVVSATGTIKPENMVDISSKITGLIKELRVKENDRVAAGQVLVVLDSTRLETQVAQAKERLNNASANYERNQHLHSIGAVSDQQLDASRLDYKVAQASYDDATSQFNDTVIKSPIDGIVIGKPIPAGQTVAQGISNPMVILTVADMSKMQIETQVDETDIGKVAVGQKASFTVDAYPGKTFSGVVSSISQKATIQQNVVYYSVIIDIDNAGLLKPTMTARVSIHAAERKNVLNLPLAAVKIKNNQQYVMVLKDGGRIDNVPVTTGMTSDDRVEIAGGLNEGDQVVLSQSKPQGQQSGGFSGRGMMPPGMGR